MISLIMAQKNKDRQILPLSEQTSLEPRTGIKGDGKPEVVFFDSCS
jgi:hypothetical protein